MAKKFFIIDGNSYIHRAYHAIRGLRNREHFPTNAIYGFTNMLMKIMEESPEYIVMIFDAAKKSFRNDIYEKYKANRPPMDEELIIQIPFIKRITEAFNIPIIIQEGVEADDVIATLVEKFKDQFEIVIISSDKDLMQLIDSNVVMWDTMKNIYYTIDNVKEKFGVDKEYIIDYLSLVGDASDNIPGVKGIGPKTAVNLISKYGTLENIYENIDDFNGKKIKDLLCNNRDNAFLSKSLIRLKRDAGIFDNPEKFKRSEVDIYRLKSLFKELDFHSLLKKFNIKEEQDTYKYKLIKEIPDSDNIYGIILNYEEGFFKGRVGAFTDNGKYVYFAEHIEDIELLKSKKFITANYKKFLKISYNEKNIDFEDVLLLAYIFDPEQKNTIEAVAQTFCKKYVKPIEEYKKRKNVKISFSQLSDKDKIRFVSERACAIFHIYNFLKNNIPEKLNNLYYSLEKPLVKVLNEMERNGIYIDLEILESLDSELHLEIEELSKKIYDAAGEKFNINSPKQLREILFEKMGLDIVKRTKTGASTDNEVLELLSEQHILPKLILEYREKAKIKSTYLEGLIQLVNKKTGRIYPTFNQTVTATGRLSCTNPNIQNIPIRTEYGDKIRKAFAAPSGKLILALDYSQIELRIMAHFSNDPELINAFKNNIDIHSLTASKIYGTDMESITPEMRRDGKTVNFAIIYGISPFGLSKSLKVTREKAKIFIENYFKEYSGVKDFIEKTVLIAKEKGFVETLYGRRRFIKGIKSRNHREREFAKRIAVNTPIQGTAADIIKLAMLKIDEMEKQYNAKMIMQVHDELIYEIEKGKEKDFANKAKDIMENISPELKVKLKVDFGIGNNWFEAH